MRNRGLAVTLVGCGWNKATSETDSDDQISDAKTDVCFVYVCVCVEFMCDCVVSTCDSNERGFSE